jgi:hypothetical protein
LVLKSLQARWVSSRLWQRKLDVEIHVPISPTTKFFTMVHYLAASLRLNGGDLAESRIVVSVGDDREPEDLRARLPWARRYPIEWRWLDREIFRRHGYFGTGIEGLRYPFSSSLVIISDADVFFTGDFSSVLRRCHREGALAGLVAHISPFMDCGDMPTPAFWERVYEAAGLGKPSLVFEHTGWGTISHDPADRYCPPYFNFGMLVAPARVMREIGSVMYAEVEHVDKVLTTRFRAQIALTLAVQRLGVRWHPLSIRFNYPNEQHIASRYSAELADVRLFHYCWPGSFNKNRDCEGPERVGAWLARRDLDGVNQEMARHLERVHEVVLRDLR